MATSEFWNRQAGLENTKLFKGKSMNNDIQKVENPFGNDKKTSAITASGNSDAERAIQEVQAAMIIAKRFPRNPIESMDKIINACARPSLASAAIYSYPRGGQEVSGPSIRLAEAVAQNWGNIQWGIRDLSTNQDGSTIEAFAWDVESNTKQVKVFSVEHVRYSRAGGITKLTDPRDKYEVVANQGARRLRACILGVIPGDVIEAAVNQCLITQHANIDTSPEGIKKMLEVFEKHFSVSQKLIESRIGKRIEAIVPAQMQQLLNIAQSMKDGMSKPSDWFDISDPEMKAGPKVSDILNKKSESDS